MIVGLIKDETGKLVESKVRLQNVQLAKARAMVKHGELVDFVIAKFGKDGKLHYDLPKSPAKVDEERAAAEKAEADRLQADREAAEKAEADRIAAEKAEADRLQADREAAEKAEADRIAAEKAEADAARLRESGNGNSNTSAPAAENKQEGAPERSAARKSGHPSVNKPSGEANG